jgi:hypothetical protein
MMQKQVILYFKGSGPPPSNKGMQWSAASEFLMAPSVLRAAPTDAGRL